MIALATEVAAKKTSSEEETWSDQSLLIFKENWKGIYSQFEAFTQEVAAKDSQASTAVKEAYEAAVAVVEPYFQSGQTAAKPYSFLNATQRGEITQASYRLRDTLVKAGEILQLT